MSVLWKDESIKSIIEICKIKINRIEFDTVKMKYN